MKLYEKTLLCNSISLVSLYIYLMVNILFISFIFIEWLAFLFIATTEKRHEMVTGRTRL